MQVGKKQTGFTIVELLIVVVVIAILAAITIVAYNGVSNSANDASVRSDLAAFARKYENFKTASTTDSYPYGNNTGAPQSLDNIATKINKSAYTTDVAYNLLNCTSSGTPGSNYALLAISKSGKRFWVGSSSGGVKEFTGGTTWGTLSMCGDVLSGSAGNGAGWGSSVWRAWVN